MRTVYHVCSYLTNELIKQIINYGGDAKSIRHFIIYLSKLLLFSSSETVKFKAMRISSGGFTFRMGRGLLRTCPLQRLLGRATEKDKRREVRAPSFIIKHTMLGLKRIYEIMPKSIFGLLLSIAPIAAFGQTTDFSNYVKLDSIKYTDAYGERYNKYEYDDEGRQIGVEYQEGRYGQLNGRLTWGWHDNRLFGYTLNSYHGISFIYDNNGSPIQALYGFFPFEGTESTFDAYGRGTGYSCGVGIGITETKLSYHDNGKIKSSSWKDKSMSDELKYSHAAEYNENGQIVKDEIVKFREKPDDYDEPDVAYSTYSYFYDEDHNLVRMIQEHKQVVSNPTPEFIEQVGGQEEFDKWYNVWITYEYKCVTDVVRDDAGKIISREGYTLNPWSEEQRDRWVFTEQFTYDANGNETKREYNDKDVDKIVELHKYDNENRVVMSELRYDGDYVYHFEYAYDENGNQVITNNSFVYDPYMAFYPIKKEYDKQGNIILEESPEGVKMEYTYDSDGNRTSVTCHRKEDLVYKITYDTKTPSFRTGGFLDTPLFKYRSGYPQQITSSSYNLVYMFDEPFKVESYTKYENGQEINVELFYSPFVKTENAINTVNQDKTNAEKYFDIQGRQLTTPRKGINIVRKSDGSSRKIIVK